MSSSGRLLAYNNVFGKYHKFKYKIAPLTINLIHGVIIIDHSILLRHGGITPDFHFCLGCRLARRPRLVVMLLNQHSRWTWKIVYWCYTW